MKLVLFDIDGTLLHARGAGRRALERAIRDHFGDSYDLGRVRLDGKTDPQIIREAIRREDLSDSELLAEPLRSCYRRYLDQELDASTDVEVLPGVSELLVALTANAHFRVGVATGNMEEGASLKLERAGLRQYFQFGGYGCDSANRTRVIQTAIERGRRNAGVDVREVFVVGDTLRDVIHGREAGARVIAVATGSYSRDDLSQSGADLVLDSLQPIQVPLDFMSKNQA